MKLILFKFVFIFVLLFFESFASFAQGTWTYSYALHNRKLNSLFITDYNHLCVVGGNKTNDSIQSIYTSSDAGSNYMIVTDFVSPWLKSVFFTSGNTGISVGDYGKIIKTTDGGYAWNTIALSGIAGQRHYNSVFFTDASTGFAAGGIQLNDSVSTILKTTDGGETWTISKDNPGYWLTSVHFPSAMTGYAVGDHGILYKTLDGGSNWTQKAIPGVAGSRNFSAVYFTNDNTGFIAGGNMTNDSIQTILKTTDGGETWTVIRDNLDPMLNDIYFLNPGEGYAVGYGGTVLHSTDTGTTWQAVTLPDFNPFFNFNAVRFLNPDYGYIIGDAGIIYRYFGGFGQGPIVSTLPASDISPTSVQLNATVNANNYTTTVAFEYGTTTAYGNTVSANPSQVNGSNDINVNAALSGLSANTHYHFRVKAGNTMATNYGEDLQFYTGISDIPNFNFENWDTASLLLPDSMDYTAGMLSRVSALCHGNYAIRLENDVISESPGVFLIGESQNGQAFSGGVPFHSRPDTLTGCFNYSVIPNDTALVLLIFKKQGVTISDNLFKIYGNSSGAYVDLKFPISYISYDIPDSVIFAIACTDYRHQTELLSGSFVEVDNIHFSGTSESIPNYDFENWTNYNHITLNNWWYSRKDRAGEGMGSNLPVIISTDPHSGSFAAVIRNIISPQDTISGLMYTGSENHNNFLVDFKPISLNGFYKFFPQNGDSLFITINLKSGVQQVGTGIFKTGDTANEYTSFSANIKYDNPLIPDSAEIHIQVFDYGKPLGSSYAVVDDLNFDGFLADVEENPFVKPASPDFEFIIYPNPFSNNAVINFTLEQPEQVLIRLYHLSGKEAMTILNKKLDAGNHEITISASDIEKGFYICIINAGGKNYNKKIIIY